MADQISRFFERMWGRLISLRAWLNPINPFEWLVQRGKIDYLFFPSNDTHVKWMIPIFETMPKSGFMVRGSTEVENTAKYLKEHGYKFIKYGLGSIMLLAPKILIVGNDWADEEKKAVTEIRWAKGVSICVQEGCLNFLDENQGRMKRADFAFIQGPVMKKYLLRDNIVVTGNPKYDEIKKEPLPNQPTIMINSNFTYGVFEDVRDQWVKDVVETCMECGIEFFVSKHPRDKGVFPAEYNVMDSGAFLVNEQIKRSSILVSRFSTLIYEALCMGRKAIYYNPHHEPFRIFSEDQSGGIFIANDKSSLKRIILDIIADPDQNEENVANFLKNHCNMDEKSPKAVELIREELLRIKTTIPKRKG